MLSRKRELATADMNSHGHSDGYSRICSWAIHMMAFDVIDLLISLFHYHQREMGGSLLEGGWGQRGAIRPEEVYWGSLLGKSTGQQGPSRLPPGLDGGVWERKGKGGRGQSPPPYFSRKYGGGCVLAAGPPPYFRQNVGGNDLTRGRGGLSLPSPRPYRLTGAST